MNSSADISFSEYSDVFPSDGSRIEENDENQISSSEMVNLTNNFETLDEQELLKYKKLYLLLFLHQSHGNLTDSDVVTIAKSHELIYDDEEIPESYCTLKKRAKIFSPIVYKYLYGNCGLFGPLTASEMTANRPMFCNRICNCKVMPSYLSETYFCYIKLIDYLQYIIPQIYHLLRFDPTLPSTQPAEIIRDIVDGSIYRQLAGPDTIVIYFGFDGVQYSEKPVKKSIWPLILFLAELPFNLRQKFAFPIAVHKGNKQPQNIMLEPFISELLEYLNEPIEIAVPIGNKIQTKKFYVKLLIGICDAPARAKVLKMVQHNGFFGCNYCKTLCTSHEDINCRIYPMNMDFELRTNEEWRKLAYRAEQVGVTKANEHMFFGIRGVSPLMELPYLDMVSVLPPEFMHSQVKTV